MVDNHYGNAMTEIALALAMAFFSIMVLTMVSMGVGKGERPAINGVVFASSSVDGSPSASVKSGNNDLVIIYHEGRYFDRHLKSIDPASIDTRRRVLLALDPALPTGEAVATRARIDTENLIVTTLNGNWLRALRRSN